MKENYRTVRNKFVIKERSPTGIFPKDGVNITFNISSRWTGLSINEWDKATAANQLVTESELNRPAHNNWPVEIISSEIYNFIYLIFHPKNEKKITIIRLNLRSTIEGNNVCSSLDCPNSFLKRKHWKQ